MPKPLASKPLIPRPHQVAATAAILAARSAGRPGFLLGDMTGLGKTLAVWCAVAAMPEREVLIVCPKGAIPQWRRTISLAGLPEKAVTIVNYERCKSLMALPAASKRRSTRAKPCGQPRDDRDRFARSPIAFFCRPGPDARKHQPPAPSQTQESAPDNSNDMMTTDDEDVI